MRQVRLRLLFLFFASAWASHSTFAEGPACQAADMAPNTPVRTQGDIDPF